MSCECKVCKLDRELIKQGFTRDEVSDFNCFHADLEYTAVMAQDIYNSYFDADKAAKYILNERENND